MRESRCPAPAPPLSPPLAPPLPPPALFLPLCVLSVCVYCPAEADTETKAQTKQYNAIINEQRVLNQQLITRNSELTQLYEKLKVQHSLLKMGESTYKDKVATVRSLQAERDELVLRVQDSVGDEGEFDFMKETIISIEDQLVQEKLRVRALEAELQQPMNVHRWRRLQDTDTEKFGLLQSVQVRETLTRWHATPSTSIPPLPSYACVLIYLPCLSRFCRSLFSSG